MGGQCSGNHQRPSARQSRSPTARLTLLRKLEAKGAVGHDVEDRTFVFYSLVQEDNVRSGAVRDLVDRVFDSSVAELVSYLLQNERVPRKELDRIRKLIDGQQKKEN